MRLFAVGLVMLIAATVGVGCTPHEPPKYDDSALGAGRTLSATGTPPAANRLGLVINDNTERSIADSRQIKDNLGNYIIVNTSAQQDIDPTYLHARLLAALKRRYATVEVARDLAGSVAAGNGATVVVDVRTRPGRVSGDRSTVEINLVFYDRTRRPVARVSATGAGIIPYPAWDYGLQRAADDAVQQIAARL